MNDANIQPHILPMQMLQIGETSTNDVEQSSIALQRYFSQIFAKLPINTRLAYTSDLKCYFQFCLSHSPVLDPLVADFNQQESNLMAYMDFQMRSERKRSVIIRHFTSISKLLRVAKLRNPLKESEHLRDYIRLTLNKRDELNQLIKPAVQSQAKALDRALLNHINNTFETHCIKDLRDLALINFMAHTLLRGSEIAQIQVRDLKPKKQCVFVASTKTDQTGAGTYRFVSPQTFELIDQWLVNAKLSDGSVFRRVDPCYGNAQQKPIGYNSVYKIIKDVLQRCGIEPKGYTAHSLRVGAAVEMRRAGMTDSEIMQSGGWKSAVFHRYTQQTEVEFSGAARLERELTKSAKGILKQYDNAF